VGNGGSADASSRPSIFKAFTLTLPFFVASCEGGIEVDVVLADEWVEAEEKETCPTVNRGGIFAREMPFPAIVRGLPWVVPSMTRAEGVRPARVGRPIKM
jgi:hypothetical protein